MESKNINGYQGLESYFNKFAQNCVIKNAKTVVAFQELFFKGTADKRSIVHIWDSNQEIIRASKDGYNVIYSGGNYLDVQVPGNKKMGRGAPYLNYYMSDTFRNFYNNDPTYDFSENELRNVLGGEGCSWNESCDEENQFNRVFQRFFSIAERWWSSKELTDEDSLEVRAGYVRCIGLRRGILQGAGPLNHGYCDQQEEE